MKIVFEFFNHPFFVICGAISVITIFLGVLSRVIGWFFGITPIMLRLGIALRKRDIAIFCDNGDSFDDLKTVLTSSGIFRCKNIFHIKKNTIETAKNKTIFLVDWETFKDNIDEVFNVRKDEHTAIVIYAKPACIPHDEMNKIANRPHTVVVNFKGRLLNDVLTSLITTRYEKR